MVVYSYVQILFMDIVIVITDLYILIEKRIIYN